LRKQKTFAILHLKVDHHPPSHVYSIEPFWAGIVVRAQKPIPISEGLLARFPRKINANRMAKARELGATLDITALRGLFEGCTSSPVLVGPIHGDLHSGNVRVRATDAIVIDFVQHRDYPLVFDAACLEASLLVEGFANDKRSPQE